VAASPRRTATLRLGEVGNPLELRALDVERLYPFELTIDGRAVAGGAYASPLGDQTWRDIVDAMGRAVEAEDKDLASLRRPLDTVRHAGRQLFLSIAQLAPELRAFLTAADPRRLVIMTARSELHALPWEAMVDEQWAHLAGAGLSIVHAADTFDPVAVPAQVPLTVRKIVGPGTARRTEPAIDDLLTKASRRRQPRLARAPDGQQAAVVHIEAHGDPWKGTIDLAQPDFLDHQTSSLLVLLWSCVSNLMQPWGESLAMKLHRQQNRLVLGFTTEIREDSAGEIARHFYDRVFDGTPPLDPETAIVDERVRLYRDRLRACEWASLTVWLRGALDLGAAVLDGPRSPAPGWIAGGDAARGWDVVRDQARRFAAGGHVTVIPRADVSSEAPLDAASDYRGAALHVRQPQLDADLAECLTQLHVAAPSVHPGDRVLALVEGLAAYPNSLLLWTGVDQRAVEAMRWLTRVPASLSIVLVSESRLDVPAGMIEADGGTAPDSSSPATTADDLAMLEAYEAAGEYARVDSLWAGLAAKSDGWDPERLRRLNTVGYWSFIRVNDETRAADCLTALDRVAPSEAALLRGNLSTRRGDSDEARRWYAEAKRLSAGNAGDEGRALLELANLAARGSNAAAAETIYREALARLQEGIALGDVRWRSALGRALRDYADLLSTDEHRLDDADALLLRALVIHALDDRMSQVAVALQTRGKLARARGRFRDAEDAIGSAVALQARFGNERGWSDAMRDLIEAALDAGAPQRALALAESTLARSTARGRARGRIAALAARACWTLGQMDAAARWCEQALACLPASDRDARVRVSVIRDVARSLDDQSKR
jgi:tetratricopeptide (TPR) repeat protein